MQAIRETIRRNPSLTSAQAAWILALLVLGMTATSLNAEEVAVFFDGNDFHKICQVRPEAARLLARAWSDAAAVHALTPRACIPAGATAEQISDTFCRYLTFNPAKRHYPAAEMFQIAASEAWACP